MGLFRVAASIGMMGAVSPRSRASRDTRAIMRESKKQTELLARLADPAAYEREEVRKAEIQAQRLQYIADSKARRRKIREAHQAGRKTYIWPTWSTTTLRILGWVLAATFATSALGNAISGSVTGVLVCMTMTGSLIWSLTRRSSPRTAEGVPASQEPTQ